MLGYLWLALFISVGWAIKHGQEEEWVKIHRVESDCFEVIDNEAVKELLMGPLESQCAHILAHCPWVDVTLPELLTQALLKGWPTVSMQLIKGGINATLEDVVLANRLHHVNLFTLALQSVQETPFKDICPFLVQVSEGAATRSQDGLLKNYRDLSICSEDDQELIKTRRLKGFIKADHSKAIPHLFADKKVSDYQWHLLLKLPSLIPTVVHRANVHGKVSIPVDELAILYYQEKTLVKWLLDYRYISKEDVAHAQRIVHALDHSPANGVILLKAASIFNRPDLVLSMKEPPLIPALFSLVFILSLKHCSLNVLKLFLPRIEVESLLKQKMVTEILRENDCKVNLLDWLQKQ
jgi:hypothetical protein